MFQDADLRKSITCSHIPEAFLNKTVAKNYFSQFGTIKNFSIRPKRFTCTVEYETIEEAERAISTGGYHNGIKFDMEITQLDTKPPTPDPDMDPEVKMELQALRELSRSANTQSIAPVPRPAPTSVFSRTTGQRPIDDLKKEIEQLALKQVTSVEEKYRLLDARDKLMRKLMQTSGKNVNKTKYVIGTCPDMCPEKERLMREFQNQIPIFELADNLNHMDHSIAIKEYSRSSADQEVPLPLELRPENVLKMTMSYLLHYIVDMVDDEDSTTNVSDWFHFVWDRMRSIRKDITQQDLCSAEAVQLVEKCARFHIHCSARLVEEDPNVFDSKLNTENLTKCLQTLKYMYDDLRLRGISCPNEAEFRAYVVLLNLNNTNFLWEFKQLPDSILNSKSIRFALDVYSAISNNIYVRFFNLVRSTNYLNACILLRYFTQVRLKAIHQIVKAFSPRNQSHISLNHLTKILGFDDEESLLGFLDYHGLNVAENSTTLLLDRNSMYDPDVPFPPLRSFDLVEDKLTTKLSKSMSGPELDNINDFLDHDVYVSFTDQGYLKKEVLDELYTLLEQQNTSNATERTLFKVPSVENLASKVTVKRKALQTTKVKVQPIQKTDKTLPNVSKDVTDNLKPPASTPKVTATLPSAFSFKLAPVTPETPKTSTPKDVLSVLKPPTTASTTSFLARTSIFGISAPTKTSIFGHTVLDNQQSAEKPASQFFFTPRTQTEQPIITTSSAFNNQTQKDKSSKTTLLPPSINLTGTKVKTAPSIQTSAALIEPPKTPTDEKLSKELAKKLEKASINELNVLVEQFVQTEVRAAAVKVIESIQKSQEEDRIKIFNQIFEDLTRDVADTVLEEEDLVAAIIEARKIRLQYRVINKWLKIKNRNQLRKKQLESAPFYSLNETLHENAARFAMPGCLDYLQNDMLDSDQRIWTSKTINLLEMLVKKRTETIDNQYWKGVVMIADTKEVPEKKVKPFEKWLKRSFCQEETSDLLFKGQVYIKSGDGSQIKRKMVACLTQTKGEDFNPTSIESSCGVLFVVHAGSISASQKRFQRLLNVVEAIETNIAIVVTTTSGTTCLKVDEKQVLNDLNLEHLGDCKVFIESPELPLFECVENALDSLIDPYDETSELEMDSTAELLSKCLGQEMWLRLKNASIQNIAFLNQTTDPSFVFELFNEAVDHTYDIFNLDLTRYRKRAKEFEEFVESSATLPLKFASFKEDWTLTAVEKVLNFLKQLKLPILSTNPNDELQVAKNSIYSYSSRIFPRETAEKLTKAALLDLTQNQIFGWMNIARRICTEYCDSKWRQVGQDLPDLIPYNRNKYHEYLNLPWYLHTLQTRKFNLNISSLDNSRKRKASQENDDEEDSQSFCETVNCAEKLLFENRLKPFYKSIDRLEMAKRMKVLIDKTDEVLKETCRKYENIKDSLNEEVPVKNFTKSPEIVTLK